MEYGPMDSSGTDDDLPPTYHNRGSRGGRLAGNGRSSIGAFSYNILQNDMESQIHQLEKDAYCSVLLAFKAQADAITWEKEGLITELRKELRVSDDEHRELLGRVNADDLIQRIRQWREAGGGHPKLLHNISAVHEPIYASSVVASRKKQKLTRQPAPLIFESPMQPCSAVTRTGDPLLASKSWEFSGAPPRKQLPYSSAPPVGNPVMSSVGMSQSTGQGLTTSLTTHELAKSVPPDPPIGRKVFIKSHVDNNFHEAQISNYDPIRGQHALIYNRGTGKDTIEWVNLKEISQEDIQWEGYPGLPSRADSGKAGADVISAGQGPPALSGAGRGRGTMKIQAKKDFPPLEQSIAEEKDHSDQITVPVAENLVKEVERLLALSDPDLLEIEKRKKQLRDHEQCLLSALAKLGGPLQGDNGGTQPVPSEQLRHGIEDAMEPLAVPGPVLT